MRAALAPDTADAVPFYFTAEFDFIDIENLPGLLQESRNVPGYNGLMWDAANSDIPSDRGCNYMQHARNVLDFGATCSNGPSQPLPPAPPPSSNSDWWFPNIDRSDPNANDFVPFLDGVFEYQVYVAVSDAAGLRNAIASGGPHRGNRDNGFLAGEPRVVYLAPGTYELDETLFIFTDTILVGDAAQPPIISASSSFTGCSLVVGGHDRPGNGGELKFSTMLKNIVLHTTQQAGTKDFTALNWRVAQNSGLVNVQIRLPQDVHTGMLWQSLGFIAAPTDFCAGISMGRGSTVQVGDTMVSFGNIGVDYLGAQEVTLKNMTFKDTTVGIRTAGGFAINIFATTFDTVGFPVVFQQDGGPFVSIIDTVSVSSHVFLTSNNAFPNFVLENINIDNTEHDVVVIAGQPKITARTHVGTYVHGNTFGSGPIYQADGPIRDLSRPSQIAPDGNYPVMTADPYPEATVEDIVNLKSPAQDGGFTIKGDGSTDDGNALQAALAHAAEAGKIAFLPYGIYRTQRTITIPPGTELIGNGWSTISGYGSAFANQDQPTAVVRIGEPGQVGTAHIQDVRFTVGQQLPGAIILQVNLAGDKPGDVSIHNSLITVGGTRDTEVNCGDSATCQGAYIGMHLTNKSSAYIDNVWVWVADHPSDGSSGGTDISAKGGVLIEATKGTWLLGLGSEHFWLYNVAWNHASNVFMSFLQSESNYKQGISGEGPPSPWPATDSDPSFSWCDGPGPCAMTVGQYFNGGSDISSYGSGSWNIAGGTQQVMNVMAVEPTNSHFYGLCSGGTNPVQDVMRLPDGSTFGDGSQGYGGSWGNLVAEYTTSDVRDAARWSLRANDRGSEQVEITGSKTDL